MRTLHVRLDRAQANAAELARRLGEHPGSRRSAIPASEGSSRSLCGWSAGRGSAAHAVRLWVHATSLGGVESTLERRRRWKAEAATIPEGLLRLSVGIEDVEDLWADLDQALDGLSPNSPSH